ncbi:MAG: hypothetical protein WC998_03890 [Candidatus Paceibacterota bacterium]
MTYRLTFSKETEDKEDISKFCKHGAINIEPPLTDVQMTAIRSMLGRSNSCDAIGAEIRKVSSIRVEIASCCDRCKENLIKKIVNFLGKKVTILVD